MKLDAWDLEFLGSSMGYGRIWEHEMTRWRLFDRQPRSDADADAAGLLRCIGGEAHITV